MMQGATMSNSYKTALAIILIIALAGSAFLLLRLYQVSQEAGEETFEEIQETYVYVDERGNATCQFIVQLPPSKLANALKSAVTQIGTAVVEQLYSESSKSSWAQYGFDIENITCAVTGLSAEENFKLAFTWKTPNFAQRRDDHWTIQLDWVENQSIAKDVIANYNAAWTLCRNISKNARYYIYTKTIVVLPDGVENISSPHLGESTRVDYGSGSYSKSYFYSGQVGGRPAIIENGLSLISAEGTITLTAEQLLENIVFQTIDYDGAFPTDNWTFISSVGSLRLDSKYGRELDEQYSIFIGQSEYSLSPAQLLYYTADAIVTLNQGAQFSIQQPIFVAAPSGENGDLGAFWGSLTKTEYVSLAQQVRDNIASTGVAPGVINTPRGQIRFKDALLIFTRILSVYEDNGTLPNTILLAPSPLGQLAWGTASVPANYAYFLLGDTYAITGTSRVDAVLDNVYQSGYDNRTYASSLLNWTHANISYVLIVSPPTSEWVLVNKQGQCREYTNVYLALLRTAGIPAKRMDGWIVLTGAWTPPAGLEPFMKGTTPDGRPIGSHAWVQVYLPGEGWRFADATWGYFENVPYEIYQQQEQTWLGALAGYESAYGSL
jgi:hypothetical protein